MSHDSQHDTLHMMTVIIVVVNYLPVCHTGTSNQQKSWQLVGKV